MRHPLSPRGLILAALASLSVLVVAPAQPADAQHAGPSTHRIEVTAADPAAAAAFLQRLGGIIEVQSGDRVQALVAPSTLPVIRGASALLREEQPAIVLPLQVVSSTALIGANRWHTAGYSGRGIKIAVLDTGFAGFDEMLGVTLPEQVIARSFRADQTIRTGDHGRRAAEVVTLIAPEATLYLVTFATVTELSAAVDFLIAEEVQVVSFSLGYVHDGPGDGSGSVGRIVTRATDAGMIWSVAAGNWAQQHWTGQFRDNNRDGVHEFLPNVQEITHYFIAGDLISVSLRWEDTWGAACTDYDLELYGPDGALVRASRGVQQCSGDPVERMQVLATTSGEYAARIVRGNPAAAAPRRLDLIFIGTPDRGLPVSIPVPAGSLAAPGDHPAVTTVGALTTALVRSEAAYSSRGPTTDRRQKPEILAPTGQGAPTALDAFAGTSAAAPHVAGAMALVLEGFPELDRERLNALLQARAVAVPAVENGTSGVRRLDLGVPTPLLPPGAQGAFMETELPPGAILGSSVYRGPDGYPMRMLYRLLGGREPLAAWVWDEEQDRWRIYIVGAPAFANDIDVLDDGVTVFVILSPEPAAEPEPAPAETATP